ncbi:redox-sensing transcriptional repressor Rex [Petroclostridium sp. X23]|uniref:redox-sensing transcriptional repressor Rex n=1 Tax=Petroclostridium sp. X23 TaxID=3045146 RepID=UPI0024AD8108|nr:redox-sensing transcriptional repressor Rex [Petroclostridium sp. X23]WHH60608.1 redox-sensing transcriptional repressor Rex [Petroclostridium sp. X23]
MAKCSVSTQTLQRLPMYLNYLRAIPHDKDSRTSSKMIADALQLNDVQVRKDLALISSGGRPKIGYNTKNLILDIEQFLGYNNTDNAVIVGAGNLGHALLSYSGFTEYGLNIVAAFDVDESIIGTTVNDKKVLHINKLNNLLSRMKIRIGIITVPASQAQKVCDALIDGGVMAIWNFAPIHLNTPENILVQNEDMAYSLAVLSKHLTKKLVGTENKGGIESCELPFV